MHTAAENLKEILASTLNSLCWWIGHQTYWGVFAWTRGICWDLSFCRNQYLSLPVTDERDS